MTDDSDDGVLLAAIVRTPAGATKYGQPIGSVITRDVVPDVKARIPSVPAFHKGHVPTDAEVAAAHKAIEKNPHPRSWPGEGENSAAYLDAAGYNERPTVLPTKEFDAFQGATLANYGFSGREDLSEFWRGTEVPRWGTDPYENLTAAASEDFYVGVGIYANGTYIGSRETASMFVSEPKTPLTKSKRYPGGASMVRVKIHPDARVARMTDVPDFDRKMPDEMVKWAVDHHYDVMTLLATRDTAAGIAVFNRSVMVVEELKEGLSPRPTIEVGSTVEWGSEIRRIQGTVIEVLDAETVLVKPPWPGPPIRMNPRKLKQVGGSGEISGRVASAGALGEPGLDVSTGCADDPGLGAVAAGLPEPSRGGVPEDLGTADQPRAVTAAAGSKTVMIGVIPAADDPIHQVSSEPVAHMTMLFFGPATGADLDAIRAAVAQVAQSVTGPVTAKVLRRETLGDDQADVLMLDPGALRTVRDRLLADPAVHAAYVGFKQYPQWLPHTTIGYPDTPATGKPGDTITFDRLVLWTGDYQGPEFPLTAPMRVQYVRTAEGVKYYSRPVGTVITKAPPAPRLPGVHHFHPAPRDTWLLPFTAAGDSWRWQLRDQDGQWVNMHAEVTWLVKGLLKHGQVVGSPSPGVATVKERSTGQSYDLPSTRLTVSDVAPATKRPLAKKAAARRPKAAVTAPEPGPAAGVDLTKPHEVLITDLKPGDVFTRVDEPDGPALLAGDAEPGGPGGKYLFRRAVPLEGPYAGEIQTLQSPLDRKVLVHPNRTVPTYEQSVEALRSDLARVQQKYPNGLATAVYDVTQAKPKQLPEPQMSDELKQGLKQADYVAWTYKVDALKVKINEYTYSGEYGQKSFLIKQEQDALDAKNQSPGIQRTEQLLKEHRAAYSAWQDKISGATTREVDPRSPAAQELLSEVEYIGSQARLATSIQILRQTTINDGDIGKKVLQIRRETARDLVDRLVGTARPDQVTQTWASSYHTSAISQRLRALKPTEKTALTEALLQYPKSWVLNFNSGRQHTTYFGTRGYNVTDERHINISDPDPKIGLNGDGSPERAVMTHEIGHSMEVVIPGLKDLEQIFWHSRVEDGDLQMKPEDGAYYVNDTMLKRRTALRYTLKAYGNPYKRGQLWEVFTTGVQNVLGDGSTTYTVGDDPELWDFTMGALLTLDTTPRTALDPAALAAPATGV